MTTEPRPRTRARRLALVNWKGIFYQKFDLDPNVTALEGANGAGKTTVMIGAYVVLLPDMTKLRFTNVGEQGATGGDRGLYGRLGLSGRPSYAVLDLELAGGERLVAAVHIEKRAEPSLELTPLIISGLDDEVKLHDIFLDRGAVDAVPELELVRQRATARGGHVRVFRAVKDYFATLFELGVTPLRLTTSDERTKLNEMLRTSMVGGISRALTGGLRDFLLPAETRLASTLRHMRTNLDACRRTRMSVQEARQLEQQIRGVFDAGQRMFAASIRAARCLSDELGTGLDTVAVERAEAERRHATAARDMTAARAQSEDARRATARLEGSCATAADVLERTRRAAAIGRRLHDRQIDRERLTHRLEAQQRARDMATEAREALRAERERARVSRDAAAQGLADFQAGYAEMSRRAEAHRLVHAELEAVRAALPNDDLELDRLDRVAARLEGRIEKLDTESVRIEREIGTAHQRRREFDRVLAAVERLAGDEEEVFVDDAHALARQLLADLRELEALAADRRALFAQLDEVRKRARLQAEIRELAGELAGDGPPLDSALRAEEAFAQADTEANAHDERRLAADAAARAAAEARTSSDARAVGLERTVQRWHEVREAAAALARRWDHPITEREDLDALRHQIQRRRDGVREDRVATGVRRRELELALSQLEQTGGRYDEALLWARDLVDGELLANHFEHVDVEAAAPIQALLGPLAEAIVVDDVHTAARRLASAPDRPDTVWLVDRELPVALDEQGLPPGELLGDSALVAERGAWRLSRVPVHPTIGLAARQRRIEDLHQELDATDKRLQDLNAEHRRLDDALRDVERLLADTDLLERDDPAEDLDAARAAARDAGILRQRHLDEAHDARLAAEHARKRRTALARLLQHAHLLDAADAAVEADTLAARLVRARDAETTLGDARKDRELVESHLDVLRLPPPEPEDINALANRRRKIDAERDGLAAPLRALRYVQDHRDALAWSDAADVLAHQTELAPALKEQLALANRAHDDVEQRLDASVAHLQTLTDACQQAELQILAIDEALGRERLELVELDVEDPSEEALRAAEVHLRDLEARRDAAARDEWSLATEAVRAEGRMQAAERDAEELRAREARDRAGFEPVLTLWQRLQAEARQHTVLAAALHANHDVALSNLGSDELRALAEQHIAVLVERVEQARDPELAQLLRAGQETLRQPVGAELADLERWHFTALELWLKVRAWLRRRVPPQIAEVDDPLHALAELREHLARLEDELDHQERQLRGQASDVAANIDTRVRRARQQIRRLNGDLGEVRFGSIRGVRIRVGIVERMEQVLRALRHDDAQLLLFQSEAPFEDAIDELFRRYGGGQTGGHRLLDYREYLDLRVEVQRRGGDDWELANPTRLSTGEAIGVGAAVMMVVLTAWERDARLFRRDRSSGTLRMLFLDEATRLSQDNLGILFDLCENLELQLIIAAPEVARAEGNTAYRLVRRVDASGAEEVLVTGRRTVGRGGFGPALEAPPVSEGALLE